MSEKTKEEILLLHFRALSEMLFVNENLEQMTIQQFKGWFPRTWNAIRTKDPFSYDLPAAHE